MFSFYSYVHRSLYYMTKIIVGPLYFETCLDGHAYKTAIIVIAKTVKNITIFTVDVKISSPLIQSHS